MTILGPPRFIIRRLAFTGPNVPLVDLYFGAYINVLWGASNAGKSFAVKALDFITGGGTTLPEIDEIVGYDRCWLEVDVPKSGRITVSRALKGGGSRLYLRAVAPGTDAPADRNLTADHNAVGESLSGFLLSELGITSKTIARTLNGEKDAFTFRHFAVYMFTNETNMIGESSPIKVSPKSNETFDRNVLKFILTGVDDAAVVYTPSVDTQKAANAGKLDLIEEMLSTASQEFEKLYPENPDLVSQDTRVSNVMAEFQRLISRRQTRLDQLRQTRRLRMDSRSDAEERHSEVSMSLGRFKLLQQVYESDSQRLEALEEGGAALMAGARRPCPLCGADPEHHMKAHGVEDIERAQKAARAELLKIRSESADLRKAQVSLAAEQEGLLGKVARLSSELERLDAIIKGAKPLEITARATYLRLDQAREGVRRGLALRKRIEELEGRKALLDSFKAKRVPRGTTTSGVGGIVGHEFARVVQTVLHEWQFPGLPTVSFDEKTHDILINGKNRRGNGKGVRALMNAAFKISVMLYCREKELPHPGVVVLDSPLLSYRDPLTSRYGALSADETEITKTGLKDHFYRFLQSQSDKAQFVIIENYPPTVPLGDQDKITVFVGAGGQGERKGLF